LPGLVHAFQLNLYELRPPILVKWISGHHMTVINFPSLRHW
jgi:hypothetical protein